MPIVPSLLVLVALAAASAGCQSVEPQPDVDPAGVDPSANSLAVNSLGQAVSPCGRYTLRLDHAEWRDKSNEMIHIDKVADGDPLAWTLERLRLRLAHMLERAGLAL